MPVILMAAFALSLQKASAPEGFTPQLPFINEFRFNALDDDDDDDQDDAFDNDHAPNKVAKMNRPSICDLKTDPKATEEEAATTHTKTV